MNESNEKYKSFPEEDSWDQRWEEKWSDGDDKEGDSEFPIASVDEKLSEDSVSSAESYKQGMNGFSLAITATCLMVIPGVIGSWLDSSFQTKFLGLTGIILGMVLAISYLLISQNKLSSNTKVNEKTPSGSDLGE